MTNPTTVIINARNRPIYLWTCLDALYRLTKTPAQFILVDMASDDPLTRNVVEAFERRGMISEVVRIPKNDPALFARFVIDRISSFSSIFAYVEADAVVLDDNECWLSEMLGVMQTDDKMAMLGAAIDPRDFVSLEQALVLEPELDRKALRKLIKHGSSERTQNAGEALDAGFFRPHSPAGRFMLLRSAAIRQVGIAHDSELDSRLRAAGYSTAISTRVRHRHLSLLHIFDEPRYDVKSRDRFMEGLQEHKFVSDADPTIAEPGPNLS